MPKLLVLATLAGLAVSANTPPRGEWLRPAYHFTPRRGWTNDPNGMNFRSDPRSGTVANHLFFQANPNSTAAPWSAPWAPAYWAHAVSQDLVHWEEVSVSAIRGASGAIVVLPQKMSLLSGGVIAIATLGGKGFWTTHDPDELDWAPPQGCSDAGPPTGKVTCNGTAMNPKRPGIWLVPPAINTSASIGDPTVAWVGEDGRLYGVYASIRCPSGVARSNCTWRVPGGQYQALLFRTQDDKDPFSWEFVSVLWEAPPSQRNSKMGFTNCPDFFQLPDGRWVFSYLSHATSYGPTRVLWFIGHCDSSWSCAWDGGSGMVDASHAFTASQSFTDATGRRIVMGWIDIPGYHTEDAAGHFRAGFRGGQSIPRVMVADRGSSLLRFLPLPELSKLHGRATSFSESLEPGSRLEVWNGSSSLHLNLTLAVSDVSLRSPRPASFSVELLGEQQIELLPPYSAEGQRILRDTDTDGPMLGVVKPTFPSEASPTWCSSLCLGASSCGAWTLKASPGGIPECRLKRAGGRTTLGDVGAGCAAEGVEAGGANCTSSIVDWQLATPGLKQPLPVVLRSDNTLGIEIFVDKVVGEVFLHDARGEGAAVSTFGLDAAGNTSLVGLRNSAAGVLHASGTLWPMSPAISPSPIPSPTPDDGHDGIIVM